LEFHSTERKLLVLAGSGRFRWPLPTRSGFESLESRHSSWSRRGWCFHLLLPSWWRCGAIPRA